ncbi:MAG: DUF4446 family protein [Nocardioidaceae bacterium]
MPFDATTLSWLILVTLALSVAALLVAVRGWQRAARRPGRRGRTRPRPQLSRPARRQPLAADQVAAELELLRVDVSSSLRHLAVVRYDAFGDMGGHLSWSMALLDDGGDGVVLTSIHGRSDSRTYAKNVAAWTAHQQLSPEEEEAIGFARSEA